MSVDERQRHQLYNRAVEVLGEEEAEILMAHLPPGGYPNLATKQDVVLLKRDLDSLSKELRLAFRGDIESLRGYMERGFRRVIMWMAGLVVGGLIAGMGVAATIGRSL